MLKNEDGRDDASQQILSRLEEIKHKVDSLGQTHAFALRLDKKEIEAVVRNLFKSQKRKAQAYLAANGERSVNEIADHLGMQRQNVGPLLKSLADEDLLETFPVGRRDVWNKLPVDRTIGIAKILMDMHALDYDGLPMKMPKKVTKTKQ